jgi:hypothetical protein
MMTQKQVIRGRRTVAGKEYPFFYNPMWSFMGDLQGRPAGTHYFYRAELVDYGWNMYDQVLLRPCMIPLFDFNSLKIITSVNEESLLTSQGIPDKSKSDHLPILFKLKL